MLGRYVCARRLVYLPYIRTPSELAWSLLGPSGAYRRIDAAPHPQRYPATP